MKGIFSRRYTANNADQNKKSLREALQGISANRQNQQHQLLIDEDITAKGRLLKQKTTEINKRKIRSR